MQDCGDTTEYKNEDTFSGLNTTITAWMLLAGTSAGITQGLECLLVWHQMEGKKREKSQFSAQVRSPDGLSFKILA